jgi:6,7-dimethyl-8-ribityllumazine synthase
MHGMTERYDDFRRPFSLDDAEDEKGYPEPEPLLEAPWDRPERTNPVPAYAAEDAVEDVDEDEEEPDLEPESEFDRGPELEPEPVAAVAAAEPAYVAVPEPEPEPEPEDEPEPEPEPAAQHAPAGLDIPVGYRTLHGEAHGEGLAVAVVVSRFNGEITNRLLKRALDELESHGVVRDAVTVAAVPGAFELPLAAMALAKTRRYGCVVALGCLIRGETKHFDFISSEAASGLQLAALETGTPVAFGVLTCETREQAEARIDRAEDAVRTALEMADMFAQLRASAAH